MLMIRHASLAAHVRQHRFRHADDAGKADVEQILSPSQGTLLCGTGHADAGIVDQDVEPTEPLHYLLDRGIDRAVIGHIEVDERHAAVLGDTRDIAARADHREARMGKCQRGRRSDTRGRTCHQRHCLLRPSRTPRRARRPQT
jgi:hypothetical protein